MKLEMRTEYKGKIIMAMISACIIPMKTITDNSLMPMSLLAYYLCT